MSENITPINDSYVLIVDRKGGEFEATTHVFPEDLFGKRCYAMMLIQIAQYLDPGLFEKEPEVGNG